MTISPEALQRSLLEAVFDEAALLPALQMFAQFCEAPFAQLMIADGRRSLLQSTFSQPFDPAIAAREVDYQEINPRVLAIPMMAAGKATRDQDFITREEIERDIAYQELILPLGLGHFCGVPIINSVELTAGIALHRQWEGEAFSDEEAARHEYAAACVAPVFGLLRSMRAARARSALELAGPHDALAFTDTLSKLVDRTEAMDALIAAKFVSISADGRLCFPDRADTERLDRCIRGRGGVIGGRFPVRDTKGALWICTVTPAPQINGGFHGVTGALIRLESASAPPMLDTALVREAFNLTPAETAVAELLMQGQTLEEMSRTRKVSLHTSRSIMKKLFWKTDTRRQAELILRLTPFILPGRAAD